MTKEGQLSSILEEIDQQLDIPNQIWLFGAGVSFNAGVPLMFPLTLRVAELLADPTECLGNIDTGKSLEIFQSIREQLRDGHHVEHVLSYLGDLVSLASHQSSDKIKVGKKDFSLADLRFTHRHVLLAIRYTVEFGYIGSSNESDPIIGTPAAPCVKRDEHDHFVDALFEKRRAGLEHRPPVRFVTTNYDTLLEDALAAARIGCVDGFAGGATGFWDPRHALERLTHAGRVSTHTATICKLHGSIDWIVGPRNVVMRVRSAAIDPEDPDQTLLIYPQATKYQVTQRDPFASLFTDFRNSLSRPNSTVLVICGYSFGDEHINEEIETALRTGSEGLSIIALCCQNEGKDSSLADNEGLPSALHIWLSDPSYQKRIRVLGSRGYYRGSLTNQLPDNRTYNWWTFQGIATLLANGTEAEL